MRWRDDIKCQIQTFDLIQFLRQDRCERIQDVGEILDCLFIQQALIRLVVKEFFHSIVLTERIIGKQDVVAGHIGRHRIRPVQHPHL